MFTKILHEETTMKKFLALCSVFLLAGCLASGPEKTLDNLATALTKKDSTLFLAQFDMSRYASAHLQNMTQDNPALRTLDSVGKMLGIGDMEDVLGSIADTKGNLTDEFKRGVSTGELALVCGKATSPDCPWVAASLRAAKVKELGPNAAIAQITSPTNIASWLALSNKDGGWLIVGQAALEEQAAHYATGAKAKTPPAAKPKSAPATPQKPAPQGQDSPEKPTAL